MKRFTAVLVTLLLAGAVSGYVRITTDQQNPTGLGDVMAWDLTNSGTSQAEVSGGAVLWRVHASGSADILDGSDLTAVQNAMDTLSLPGLSAFTGSYLGTTTSQSLTDDGLFPVFWWETSNTGPGGIDLTGAVGLAVVFVDTVAPERGEIIDANIVFNGFASMFTTTGAAGAFDIEKVALHEFGHCVGADHTPVMAATMYYSGNYAPGALGSDRSLAMDDIAMLEDAYPNSCTAGPTGQISGTVFDSGSSAVFGAHVVAIDSSGRVAATTLTQDTGRYVIRGLAPGTYQVWVDPLDPDSGTDYSNGFYLFSRQELVSTGYYTGAINTGFKTFGPTTTTVSSGSASAVNVTLAAGAQTVDIDLIGDCTVGVNFVPRAAAQGSTGNLIAVTGPGIPVSGTPLSITGSGVNITATTFPCTFGSYNAVQVTFDVAANAVPGPRTLVIDTGSQKALAVGALEILAASFCPDGNEPNDTMAQPTPILCSAIPGGPMTTTARPSCIDYPGDQDWFVFEAPPLTSVTIRALNGGAFPADLQLFDGAGNPLPGGFASGPDATIYNKALPFPGCYLVRVTSAVGAGPYQLMLGCHPACPNPWNPIPRWADMDTDDSGGPIPPGPQTLLDDQYRKNFGVELAGDSMIDVDPLALSQVMANYDPVMGIPINDGMMVIAFTDPTQGDLRQTASCISFDVASSSMFGPGAMVDVFGFDFAGNMIAQLPAPVSTGGQAYLQAPGPPPNSFWFVAVLDVGGMPFFGIDNLSVTVDIGSPPFVPPCTATAAINALNGTDFCTSPVEPVFDIGATAFDPPPASCAGLGFVGSPKVQWFLDGGLLAGETGPLLDLTPYGLGAGSYVVDAVVGCPVDDTCFADTAISGGSVEFHVGTPPLMPRTMTATKNASDEAVFDFPPPAGPPPALYRVLRDTDPAGSFATTAVTGTAPPLVETPAPPSAPLYLYRVRAERGGCVGAATCDETLEESLAAGPMPADYYTFDTASPNTTITLDYGNTDDGIGGAAAFVAIEVFDAGSGCGAPVGPPLFQTASCDYPVVGGPGDPECPDGSVLLPSVGTHCLKIFSVGPIMAPHCYTLRMTADQPVTALTLIGDDQP